MVLFSSLLRTTSPYEEKAQLLQQQNMASRFIYIEAAERLGSLTLPEALELLGCLVILVAIKRRYFSAISKYPGPFVASFSTLWQFRHAFKGSFSKDVFALHMIHGL